MTASLIASAAQICAFALGCALIHAARAHAAAVTRLLTGTAAVTAAFVMLAAVTVFAPEDRAQFDEVTVHAALSLQATGVVAEAVDGP